MPLTDLERGVAILRHWLVARLPDDRAVELLTAVKLSCAARAADHADLTLQLGIYARRCSGHPAGAVIQALYAWPRRSKWFPAWQELEVEITAQTRPVHQRLRALEAAVEAVKGNATAGPVRTRRGAAPRKRTAAEKAWAADLLARTRAAIAAQPDALAPRHPGPMPRRHPKQDARASAAFRKFAGQPDPPSGSSDSQSPTE